MQKAVRGHANPLDQLDSYLRQTIFGQDRAIESLLRALNRARYGFSAGNHHRPRACLLFLGPTGVGKSECARRIAQALHPTGAGFLKIDCSLFAHGHEVSALLGAPPSYVGREQKPLLDPDIIEQDNAVILFDEIEKGHHELWSLLLQIMEDGEITLLNTGRRVSFRRAVIVLTTNVGAKDMQDAIDRRHIGFNTPMGDVEKTGEDIYKIGFKALQRVFSPEWINRLDEIIAFRPHTSETLAHVFDRMLREANERYLDYGVYVEMTADARRHVLKKGFNPRFGARPLRNRLLKDVEAPLADLLASGGIPEGSKVLVDLDVETDPVERADGVPTTELAFLYETTPELQAVAAVRREERERAIEERRREQNETPPGGAETALSTGAVGGASAPR